MIIETNCEGDLAPLFASKLSQQNLTHLDLSQKGTLLDMRKFGYLKNLKSLAISNAHVVDFPKIMKPLVRLESFKLTCSNIETEDIFGNIRRAFCRLKKLELVDNIYNFNFDKAFKPKPLNTVQEITIDGGLYDYLERITSCYKVFPYMDKLYPYIQNFKFF